MFGRFGPWEILLIGIIFSPVYFVPSIVAAVRKTKSLVAIIVLNLFVGWTFFGWVGSLVWALVAEKKSPPPVSSE
jgi:hypothetical protein